jgi:hypothetical protein
MLNPMIEHLKSLDDTCWILPLHNPFEEASLHMGMIVFIVMPEIMEGRLFYKLISRCLKFIFFGIGQECRIAHPLPLIITLYCLIHSFVFRIFLDFFDIFTTVVKFTKTYDTIFDVLQSDMSSFF